MSKTIENQIATLKNESKSKQLFIDKLTHELRTPLTSIIGYADLVLSTKMERNEELESVNQIYREGKKSLELIKHLFELIIDKEFNKEIISIKSIIQNSLESLKLKSDDKRLNIVLQGNDFTINVDKNLIYIAITNFIDNAIKFSNNNSDIDIKMDSEMKTLEIEDYGFGISETHISKIKEPFFQIDKDNNPGKGLGLSIADEILSAHKIDYSISSDTTIGTKITLFF